MKNKRILPIILATIVISSNMIGCEKSNDITTNETPYYTLNIDGEKQFFNEEHDEVKNISSFIEEYLNLSVNIDYTNKIYLDQFALYTDEIVAIDTESGFYDLYEEKMTQNELIEILDSYEITEIDFYDVYGSPYATVTFNCLSTLSHGSEEYLESNGFEIGKQYKTNMSLKLLKQDNGWRLEEILTSDIIE